MTENNETKEHTIEKLSNLTWQRKLNVRNLVPRSVNEANDQFWNSAEKPNSESRFNHELKQDLQSHLIHQTQAFKAKNDHRTAPKQTRDDNHFVKLQEGESNSQKTFSSNREISNDQKHERQPKTRNDYHGQNYHKDEKENVNVQKYPIYKSDSGNQIYSPNQKYCKDENQNFRRNENYAHESSNQNENGNFYNQRNSTQQPRNYNQNNRGYHRNQDKSNYQNNHYRNDAKNRNNYQNSHRNQQFHQNNASFKKNHGNSFAPQGTNYSKPATSPENPTPGIHYQRTFSPKTSSKSYISVTNNQSANSTIDDNFIPETERFAQLNLSSEKCSSNENYSNGTNRLMPSQFSNFNNANISNDLLSDQFTAGISEPIITNVYQNDTFRNSVQLNHQSNIPNFADNYRSSSQPLIIDNFTNSSYSNQIIENIPNFSSLSPEVADFVPATNQIQNVGQMEFSSPLISNQQERNSMEFSSSLLPHQQERTVENACAFSFSTPSSNQPLNSSWLSPNDIFDCNETMNSENNSFSSFAIMPPSFNQRNSSEVNDIFNRPASVPNTSTECQTFNFNGRIINLSDKQNQVDANQHPPTYDNVPNLFPYQDDAIGDQLNYDNSMNSGTNNYSGKLSLNNQQLTNILQIASLRLDQPTNPVSSSSIQHISDMLQMSNLNGNLNQNMERQTNVSILSPSVVNSSSDRSICNAMQDYYRKPTAADVVKCGESDEMNSQFTKVAQQLFNVNNFATSAEMNSGIITTKDSVCETNGQFNMSTFRRYKNQMEKYRQSGNFANDRDISLLSPNNSKNQYDIFTPTSIESSKSYDTFSSQTFVSSNFSPNEKQQLDIGSRYNDAILNNNSVLPTEFLANTKTLGTEPTNDFQNNYGRGNVPMNNNARYRYANVPAETNTLPKNRQNSFRNEFNRSNNNRRMFGNQVRITNNEPANSMTISVRDDCFINFTRKARPEDHNNPKFPITIGEPPSVGILKKPPKPNLFSDTSIQFQKCRDQNADNLCISPKETPTCNKRVSFALENDQQEIQ